MSQEILSKKLQAIKDLVDECFIEIGTPAKKPTIADSDEDQKENSNGNDVCLQIVNRVGDCEECDAIQEQVLDKRSVDGKILLCFYISHKYFKNVWLTSGDIEKITSGLGVKIDKKNVSNYLVKLRPYLESGAARKKGQSTPYRLNRKGIGHFEEIINVKEI